MVLVLALALAPAAFAQGCSMCRENAAAAGDGGRTLNFAILVLLVPTLGFFIGIMVFSLRRADVEPKVPVEQKRGETLAPLSWRDLRVSLTRFIKTAGLR